MARIKKNIYRKNMIYVGTVVASEGVYAGPIYGSRYYLRHTLELALPYIKEEENDHAYIVIEPIYKYELKKIIRLFNIKRWQLYLQKSKARKQIRARRHNRLREEAEINTN